MMVCVYFVFNTSENSAKYISNTASAKSVM